MTEKQYFEQFAGDAPTDEDLQRILDTDYPTKHYAGGQHRQAGKMFDFFRALNAQVQAEELR